MTSPEVTAVDTSPILTTHPLLGAAAALLGAGREQFHSNILGLNVRIGNGITDHGLLGFRGALSPDSTGPTALGRVVELIGMQVRQQVFMLAVSDSFLLIAMCCASCLAVVAFMSRAPTQYSQIIVSISGSQ
jgi:DHA2 family multidrug resistance protein